VSRLIIALLVASGCSSERAPRQRRPRPAAEEQPAERARAIAIHVGTEGCAVLEDGRVACWVLADPAPVAELMPDIAGAVQVAHGCARNARGGLTCWRGRVPDDLPPLAHLDQSCALTEDGHVLCWGAGLQLQLDWGSTGEREAEEPEVPLLARTVIGVEEVVDLSCHPLGVQCLAVARDRRVWSWGLRDGHETPPEPLRDLEGAWVAVGMTDACVRGEENIACSGLGTRDERVVIDLPDTQGIAAGRRTCAITEDGGVACWGLRDDGYDATPRPIEGLTGVEEIDLGAGYGCARLEDGSVWCWDEESPDRRARVAMPSR
jgi:hypothetical protein